MSSSVTAVKFPKKAIQKGNRYPSYLQDKLDSYIEYITEYTDWDTPEMRENKNRLRKQISDYITDISPVKSPSAIKSKYLTVGHVRQFLDATGISGKTFFEFCMKENSNVRFPEDERWVEIFWPTAEMKTLCDFLETMTAKKRSSVLALIKKLHPAYYPKFEATMQRDSAEYKDEPAFTVHSDAYLPMKCEDCIGDRMRYTLDYILTGTTLSAKKECDAAGLHYSPTLATNARHYWLVFNLEDIWAFCLRFGLSPHWILFGRQPITVLAKDIETEKVMDEFALLPKQEQKIVIGFAKQLAGK